MHEKERDAYLKRAEGDFGLCRVLLGRAEEFSNEIGFHAQQCIEKYLKALLVQAAVEPPWRRKLRHDLLKIAEVIRPMHPDLPLSDEEAGFLNPMAVEFRYIGEDVSAEEARRAVDIAAEVRAFARPLMGLPEE